MKKLLTPLNKLLRVLFGLLLVMPIVSFAQLAPVKLWDKTFGGTINEHLWDFQLTSDGGYILGGFSTSSTSGDKSHPSRGDGDFWVVKLDSTGNKIWDKTFGGNNSDILISTAQTSDGGYILGGSSNSDQTGDKSQPRRNLNNTPDYWVVKIDPNGIKIWDKTFGGTEKDELSVVLETPDGGFLLGGTSFSGQNGDKSSPNKGASNTSDLWLIKTDAFGNKVWDKTYGGNNTDQCGKISLTNDKGFIIIGNSTSGISGDKTEANKGWTDFWVLKLDSAGNKQWDKTIGGNDQDFGNGVEQTVDGGYILGGTTQSGISGDKTAANKAWLDYWVVKLNSSGIKQWDRNFSGNDGAAFTALHKTVDGGFIVGGYSKSGIGLDKTEANKGKEDIWIIKLNNSGNKVWDKSIGGSDTDYLTDVHQTKGDSFVVAGTSFSNISGDKTQLSRGWNDFWIVKLTPGILGVKESEFYTSLSIHPNPSQGKFNLQLNGLSTPKVEVSVSDLLGRIILQKVLPVGNRQVSEELEIEAAKGMYLLQIKAGNKTTTRKLVVE